MHVNAQLVIFKQLIITGLSTDYMIIFDQKHDAGRS